MKVVSQTYKSAQVRNNSEGITGSDATVYPNLHLLTLCLQYYNSKEGKRAVSFHQQQTNTFMFVKRSEAG